MPEHDRSKHKTVGKQGKQQVSTAFSQQNDVDKIVDSVHNQTRERPFAREKPG